MMSIVKLWPVSDSKGIVRLLLNGFGNALPNLKIDGLFRSLLVSQPEVLLIISPLRNGPAAA